jgi:hypothetical protein
MRILRSPGPATDPSETILQDLHSLHPPDTNPLQQHNPTFHVPLSAFSFIDGKWLAKQICRAKRATAVDQWGWDNREMWRDILNDPPFLNDVAKLWILPVAAGYLPDKYQTHLAGGRMAALSNLTLRPQSPASDPSTSPMYGVDLQPRAFSPIVCGNSNNSSKTLTPGFFNLQPHAQTEQPKCTI